MTDQKLWKATVIVYTMGETEKEAKENIDRSIVSADDLLELEEDTLTHLENEKTRQRIRDAIFHDLKRLERRI